MAKSAAAQANEGLGGRLRSWPQRTKGFYGDVRAEMKKVTSPSSKQVRATTVVVLISVFLFGLYFFIVDSIFAYGMNQLLSYFTR